LTAIERYIDQETRRQLALRGLGAPPEHIAESKPIEEIVGEDGFFARLKSATRQFKWWELLLLGGTALMAGAVTWEALRGEPAQEVRFVEPVDTIDTPAD